MEDWTYWFACGSNLNIASFKAGHLPRVKALKRYFYFEENNVKNNFKAMVQFQKVVIALIIGGIPTMLHFRFFFIIVLCYNRKWEETNDSY